MSAFHAALGGMIAAAGVGMTMAGRNWPAPSGARRRRDEVISEELMTELLGPPTPYTTGFEHAPAPMRPSFGDCPTCQRSTAGSLNRDGWLCGECLQPVTIPTTGSAL